MNDRYGRDVLAVDPNAAHRRRRRVEEVEAEPGLVVECAYTAWCGAIVGMDKGPEGWAVVLEDRHGVRRPFTLMPAAFLLDGRTITLTRPTPSAPTAAARSASGSFTVANTPAKVARGSRIWVEGVHDAELVEKVWGHDLRVEGVVVEYLEGVDHLPSIVEEFGLAGATVDARTSRMGSGISTWNDGIISACNAPARLAGVDIGMRAQEAARLLVRVSPA